MSLELQYSCITNEIRVTVQPPFYVDERSTPHKDRYAWFYCIKIKNNGCLTVQLLKRYWKLIDYTGKVDEISEIGIMGEQPILRPGEVFEYISGTYLNAPSGIMQGKYEFISDNSELFEVKIPLFSLDSPYMNKRPH
ncbi:MAG: protein ApaG [Candidatus Mesenet longicola]|uniref:Protein ApaG n=1 Tax=Candidatus Mesenet longicola TaxID=1892558 RepID=A0A8J3MNM8_9RICK|nr:MAG: protein ApaG [Candidatus Mesenet longicola]GHM59118.1 MAG: protein ApaG [Candidatus Mesenet longicola]